LRICLLMRIFFLSAALFLFLSAAFAEPNAPLLLHTRHRVRSAGGEFSVVEGTLKWDPGRTAIVVCDMWDNHWCTGAAARVNEMAPRVNETLQAARARHVFIIHCPSDTMKFYEGTPARLLAQSAPKVEAKVPLQRSCKIDLEKEAPLPIDDSDGGCENEGLAEKIVWTRQHPAIEIVAGDAVTDSAEAYYLMEQRGIENVMVLGVHANMCVLGRPFAIRQMVAQGKNVVLVRDLTDAMYNPKRAPFVSHARGTALVVEHIEKYWCPSMTSADLLGGEPFRFKQSP
jgi:nicotinamidase-related amidase